MYIRLSEAAALYKNSLSVSRMLQDGGQLGLAFTDSAFGVQPWMDNRRERQYAGQ